MLSIYAPRISGFFILGLKNDAFLFRLYSLLPQHNIAEKCIQMNLSRKHE